MDILINPLCSDLNGICEQATCVFAWNISHCVNFKVIFQFSQQRIFPNPNMDFCSFVCLLYEWQPDHTPKSHLLHYWTMSRNTGFRSSFFVILFQLSEVPNTFHLRSVSGMGNALTVQNALSPWWARNSSLSRMTSFAANVALLCSSEERCAAALFSLYNNVVHCSAVRKPYKRYYSYLVIQVTFHQQFNSVIVLSCL